MSNPYDAGEIRDACAHTVRGMGPCPACSSRSAQDARIAALESKLQEAEAKADLHRYLAEQHTKLCLASGMGDDVWPCGCLIEITDSHGMQRLFVGDPDRPECDHHAELRAKVEKLEAENQRLQTWISERVLMTPEEIAKAEAREREDRELIEDLHCALKRIWAPTLTLASNDPSVSMAKELLARAERRLK